MGSYEYDEDDDYAPVISSIDREEEDDELDPEDFIEDMHDRSELYF